MQFNNLDVREITHIDHKIWMCPFCITPVNMRDKIHSSANSGCGSARMVCGNISVAYLKRDPKTGVTGGIADTKTQGDLLQKLRDMRDKDEKIE